MRVCKKHNVYDDDCLFCRRRNMPPVSSSEIVSLCGVWMSKDAKRKMLVLHQDARWPVISLLEKAFKIGFEEGVKSAQPNDKLSHTAPTTT